MAFIKTHQDKSYNGIVIISVKKLEINLLVQLHQYINIFKMPNMHFKNQIIQN